MGSWVCNEFNAIECNSNSPFLLRLFVCVDGWTSQNASIHSSLTIFIYDILFRPSSLPFLLCLTIRIGNYREIHIGCFVFVFWVESLKHLSLIMSAGYLGDNDHHHHQILLYLFSRMDILFSSDINFGEGPSAIFSWSPCLLFWRWKIERWSLLGEGGEYYGNLCVFWFEMRWWWLRNPRYYFKLNLDSGFVSFALLGIIEKLVLLMLK